MKFKTFLMGFFKDLEPNFLTYCFDFLQQNDSMVVVWRITVQLLLKTVPKRLVNNFFYSALQAIKGNNIGKPAPKTLNSQLIL